MYHDPISTILTPFYSLFRSGYFFLDHPVSTKLRRGDFENFDFLAFYGHFWPKFWPKLEKLAKIWDNNGHKKPKNQNIQNSLCNFVDISEMLSQNSKWGLRGYQCWKKLITDHFGPFSIQIVENVWKRTIFDSPYLCNRLELRGKWAHFEKKMSRATT